MSPIKKRARIQRDHPKLSISRQCKLVRLSRSVFYYAPLEMDAGALIMTKEIGVVFTNYILFGSRQIAAYGPQEGTVVARHRVRRLVDKMGLRPITNHYEPVSRIPVI